MRKCDHCYGTGEEPDSYNISKKNPITPCHKCRGSGKRKDLKMSKKNELSPSEALFGFCGWLTTRNEKTVLSGSHDAAPVVDLIKRFCNVNNLKSPREKWVHNLKHPKD